MTANSFAEDVQASLDAGMNAHLSKPIVIDEVIKTILRYVDTSTFGTRNK
jgi:CheY-like chemotaxis protein